jgi:hypothetical protein
VPARQAVAPAVERPVAERSRPAQPSEPGSSPADLVREVHVLYARSSSGAEASSAGACPRATTCAEHRLRPARWPTDATGRATITFAYNDDGRRNVRAPQGLLGPALRASLGEWSRWNSNIVFRSQGTTSAAFGAEGPDGSCDDGTNVITWEKFPRDVIGAAVMCFDRTGRVIRDADLALNATQHWERVSGEPESRHSYDIQSILTHELGHWLGLEDVYSASSSRQTMHGNTQYGETRKRTPALGDVIGLQEAYPCDAGDRCPREGIVDD